MFWIRILPCYGNSKWRILKPFFLFCDFKKTYTLSNLLQTTSTTSSDTRLPHPSCRTCTIQSFFYFSHLCLTRERLWHTVSIGHQDEPCFHCCPGPEDYVIDVQYLGCEVWDHHLRTANVSNCALCWKVMFSYYHFVFKPLVLDKSFVPKRKVRISCVHLSLEIS